MKKLSKLIPEYDKLVPILFLLLLNLVAYANYNYFISDVNFKISDVFVLIISFMYAYVCITPKYKNEDMICFVLLISFVSVMINNTNLFNIIGTLIMIMYFKNKQSIIKTFFKIFVSILVQFLLYYIYFNFIGNSYLVFSIVYFPFSILIYKIWRCKNVGSN